jgi:hypothetical protein
MSIVMKKISTLHTEWIKDADYRKEFLALAVEFNHLNKAAMKSSQLQKNG